MFLKKNQTIAPYFREFLMNKRRKQKTDAQQRHQRASELNEQNFLEKFKYFNFNL